MNTNFHFSVNLPIVQLLYHMVIACLFLKENTKLFCTVLVPFSKPIINVRMGHIIHSFACIWWCQYFVAIVISVLIFHCALNSHFYDG